MQDKVIVEHRIVIDESEDLQRLYQAARNAKEASNSVGAQMYYESICARDPNNWEPVYYSTVLRTDNITKYEIDNAVATIDNCLLKVFELILEIESKEEQKIAVKEVTSDCLQRTDWFVDNCYQYYPGASDKLFPVANMIWECGNCIELFDMTDNDYKSLALTCFKKAMSINNTFRKKTMCGNLFSDESLDRLFNQIKKYDSSYSVEIKKQSGCYVATAVYGSYDCPEVWTLRRYRDYSLALTWYGRLFITLYYSISPTIVKWFGHTKWFNNLWRSKLDRMVKKLQSLGYEDTPYNDKYRE